MRVLVYTTLFPNSIQPLQGTFVLERMRHLLPFINMTAMAPIPYFPRLKWNKRWFNFATVPQVESLNGFETHHPRYLVIPKIGMTTHGLSMFAGSVLQVWRRLRAADYDLIDAHYVYPDGLAAVMLGALLKKPVVVSARGSDISLFPQYRLIRPLVKLVLKRADAVIAVAQSLKDVMVQLGCPENKIKVIRNGIDPEKFRPQCRADARRELGLPDHSPILLAVGGLTANKGFHVLIEAVARLRRNRPDVTLLIVGDGAHRSRLEQQIRSLNLENNVKLMGSRPNSDLSSLYSAADLFCLASEREGCPNVVLEALACGCPVIATRAGGISEIVSAPSLGVLVDRTAEAFESGIDSALQHEWDREAIAVQGRSRAWHHVAADILTVYSEVLNR
jgi:teichuronic acid biosynthesis glycosyltransferase TuaC